MNWTIDLCGEIHTDRREQVEQGARAADSPASLASVATDPEACAAAMAWARRPAEGVDILKCVTSS